MTGRRRAAVGLLGGLVAVLGLTACGTEEAPGGAPPPSASAATQGATFAPDDCERLDPAAVAADLDAGGDGAFSSTGADRLSTGSVLSCAATWRDDADPRGYVDLTATVQRFAEPDHARRAWADAERQARLGGEVLGVPDDSLLPVTVPDGAWDDALVVASARTLDRPRYGDDDLEVEVVTTRMWARSGLTVSQVTIVDQGLPGTQRREALVADVRDAAAGLLERSLDRG